MASGLYSYFVKIPMNDFSQQKKSAPLFSYRSVTAGSESHSFFSGPGSEGGGLLREPNFSVLDLGNASCAHRLTDGFHPIEEGKHRWMGEQGTVLLDIPPHSDSFSVSGYIPDTFVNVGPITLTFAREGRVFGAVMITTSGPFTHAVKFDSVVPVQRSVRFTITASRTYIPAEITRGSEDRRKLSVILSRIAVRSFQPMHTAPHSAPASAQPYFPHFEGTCVVCGAKAIFVLESPELHRETMTCPHCNSSNRTRQLARGMLKVLGQRGFSSDTIARLAAELPEHQDVLVYDTDSRNSISRFLRPLSGYTTSDYLPGVAPGTVLGERHSCQDLSALTLGNGSCDLVLTSDVFEHVRLYRRSFDEIFRVLKPGGALIFTVPFDPDSDRHVTFVDVEDPSDASRDRCVREKVFHGDPLQGSGALLYRIYGRQIFDELEEAGFVVNYERSTYPDLGIYDAEIFVCYKPGILAVPSLPKGLDARCTVLNIELSSMCNLRCRWCILDHEKPKQFLPIELLESLLAQVAGGKLPDLRRIDFHNGGETLLHPDIDRALRLIRDSRRNFQEKVFLSLLTNGTVMRQSTIDLLASGDVVNEVRISIDGGTPREYERIRKNARWPVVAENVKRLADAVRTAGNRVRLGVICMVPPGKPADPSWMEPEFRSLLSRAHIVEYRHPHSWEGTLNSEEIPRPGNTAKDPRRVCKFLKHDAVLLASGEVTVCCADLNGRGIIGSLKESSFVEIHSGNKRAEMLSLWTAGRADEIPLCSTCEGYYDEEPLLLLGEEAARAEAKEQSAASTRALNDRGVELYQAGDREGAMRAFRQAIEACTDDVQSRKNLADLLLEQGKEYESLTLYNEVLTITPSDLDALIGSGSIMLSTGRLTLALYNFQRVLELDPGNDVARQVVDSLSEASPA
jgi:SAM-dependent methyltransferase